jgi:hypothetical protein
MWRSFKTWFQVITTVFAMMALLASTYAWFTANREVETSVATARTGEEKLELQISAYGGSSFQSQESVPIQQVNQTDAGDLMPVSTDDLTNFVYVPFTQDGQATVFRQVENEQYYYHGRVYLRAVGSGWDSGTKLNLYLDQSDDILGSDVDGTMLNAARLGLKFDGGSPVILKLSESSNASANQVLHTVVNGQTLGANQVLHSSGGSVSPVTDPGASAEDHTMTFENNGIQVPQNALYSMELNTIYPVDIYFYLEGCDPDCSESITLKQADLFLAFYGVISQ